MGINAKVSLNFKFDEKLFGLLQKADERTETGRAWNGKLVTQIMQKMLVRSSDALSVTVPYEKPTKALKYRIGVWRTIIEYSMSFC